MGTVTRRGFMELLGLGGVALTLPKPLSILAPVERPPLHVGRLVFTAPPGEPRRFLMGGFTLAPKCQVVGARMREFYDKWFVRLALRRERQMIDMLRCPSYLAGGALTGQRRFPYTMGCLVAVAGDQPLECWLKPGEPTRYPLPEVQMILHGQMEYLEDKRAIPYHWCGSFETVRMDRDEAARRGICPAGEPADDFSADRAEETVDWDKEGFPDAE